MGGMSAYPYPSYPRPPFPPMPAPFPPPYVSFHPPLRPPSFAMYPPGPAGVGSPFMSGPMSVGGGGSMLSPPPVQSPWNTVPPFPVSSASAVGPHNVQPPPPPQTPGYIVHALHQQHQHQQHQQMPQQHLQHQQQLQQQLQQQSQQSSPPQQLSGLPAPQGSTSPASLASLANLAPFLSRPHVLPAPQPMHATCLSCQQRIPMPQLSSASTSQERIACPHCHTHLVAAEVVRAAEEEHFYNVLEPYASHFDVHNAALAWLSQAKPTRTGKLAVPRAFRWPKATAGKGGYADAFVAMGLVLRRNDTASGHWHCWYVERGNATFQSMQTAISRRWKENPNYRDGMLAAAEGDDGDDGDEEGAAATEGGPRKRERDDLNDDSEYIERDFSSAGSHSLGDAVDYNAHVVDIRDKSRESVKREKREGGTPVRKSGGSKDAGSTTPRSVKSNASDEGAVTATVPRNISTAASDSHAGEHSSPTTSSGNNVNHKTKVKKETASEPAPPTTSSLNSRATAHVSSATASPASSPISSDSSISALSSPVSVSNTFASTTLETMPLASLVATIPAQSAAAAVSTSASSLPLSSPSEAFHPPLSASSSPSPSPSSSDSSSASSSSPQQLTPLQA